MAPEQQNYIEKAKLNDTQELEKSIMDSPEDFDEKKVRDLYKKKLDEAAGNAPLSPSMQQKYREALQKIDENIKKFVEIRNYAMARMDILGKPIKFGEKVVIQGGVAGYMKEVPKITHNVEHLYYMQYLEKVDALLNNPPKTLTAYLDFSIKDRAKFTGIREKLVTRLDAYYKGLIEKGGKKELDKVKAGVSTGNVTLNEYVDLDDQMDLLQSVIDDGVPGAKDDISTIQKIRDRVKEMKRTLEVAIMFLPKDDKLAVDNYQKALAARDKKGESGGEKVNRTMEFLYMRDNKQRAEKNRDELLAFGGDAATLVAGTEFYEKAKKVEGSNYHQANEFYMKARDKYAESRSIYVAEQKKKKSGSKTV